jgi:hypothetical protein
MDAHFLFDAFKYGGLLTALLCGILGTVTHTHKKGRGNEKKLTGWGWLFLLLTIVGSLFAIGGQWAGDREKKDASEKLRGQNESILGQLKDQKNETQDLRKSNGLILKELEEQKRLNEEQKRLDVQKDIDYREQLDRILASQNQSIQKQSKEIVASKLKLIEPNAGWLSDSNILAKKTMDFAKSEGERIAKEAAEASLKSNQVYQDLLFVLEFAKKRALEIQKATGDQIEIPTNDFPKNLVTDDFGCLMSFKKSKALWHVYTRKDALEFNDGFPWISIALTDFGGKRIAGVNLQTKPLEDSFVISYEQRGDVLVQQSGKLSDFQSVARKVIDRAFEENYFATSMPIPSEVK